MVYLMMQVVYLAEAELSRLVCVRGLRFLHDWQFACDTGAKQRKETHFRHSPQKTLSEN